MQKRCVGSTGIEVSVIGLGTVKFGRNQALKYPHDFALPTDTEISTLLSEASQLGINLLDTAPAYGTSEERIGKLLTNRHDWVLASKVGENFQDGISSYDFSKNHIIDSIHLSLNRLQTDYLDIVFIHSNGDDKKIIVEDEVFATLGELKQAGKIRAYGMSTKTIEGGLLTIDHADIAMVTFNPIYTDESEVISYAHKKQKGIFIKKALASGHIDKLGMSAQDAIQFSLKAVGVTSVIVGTITLKNLREAAQVTL